MNSKYSEGETVTVSKEFINNNNIYTSTNTGVVKNVISGVNYSRNEPAYYVSFSNGENSIVPESEITIN